MKRFVSIAVAIAVVVSTLGYVMSSTPVSAEGSAALSIVPKKNYSLDPGESVDDTLVIRNIDHERPLYLTLQVVDFSYMDETGAPKLMLGEDAAQTTWSLKPFLTVPKTVEIAPGTSQTIDMSVSIPENQGAGSFYSAIVYSSSDSGDSSNNNVGLSASGVTLVFTNVSGDVKQDLKLEKLGAYDQDQEKYTFITNDMPDRIGYTLRNSGNVVESPVGTITLRNIFGHETVINDINPNDSLALIGQSRVFQACIKQSSQEVDFSGSRAEATTCTDAGLWPGYYSVELDAFYGQNGNMTRDIDGKASFWYLPWWFVLVAVVVLAYVGCHPGA